MAALAITAAFIAGGVIASWADRHFWLRYHFCPTCERLTTEREATQ